MVPRRYLSANRIRLLRQAAAIKSGMEIKIRKARLSDAPVITDFNLRLALETEDLRLNPAHLAAGVIAVFRDPAKGIYYVAEADGEVAGQLMITYEWSDWRNGTIWWIQSVFVNEEFRGRKIFRRLYKHLESLARKREDVCTLRLYMMADNARARRAYRRLGMKETGYEVLEQDIRH
jgi:GNAT superfamily N-acetyltransferase